MLASAFCYFKGRPDNGRTDVKEFEGGIEDFRSTERDKFTKREMECREWDGQVHSFLSPWRVVQTLPLADMSNPVHRHVVEQRWRKEGALSLLVRMIL